MSDDNKTTSQIEAERTDGDQQKIYLAVWEKAVETQMHFNEMSVKARQFGLTFVAAALGLGVVILTRGPDFVIKVPISPSASFDLHGVVVLIACSAFAMHAVRVLDLNVYHRMLRGAVTFGEDFEANYMKEIFRLEKGMTQAMSHFSRYDDADVDRTTSQYRYIGSKKRIAELKIRRFYNVTICALLGLAVMLFLATSNISLRQTGSASLSMFSASSHGISSQNEGSVGGP